MTILNELSSATGDKNSNKELVKRSLVNPAFLHTISEGLRTGTAAVQDDCMMIMAEVAKRRPEFIASFVGDFLDITKAKRKTLAKKGMQGLSLLVNVSASEIFAEREYLLEKARQGGPLGLAAADVIAKLCRESTNYRGKLAVQTLRLLRDAPAKDLHRWAGVLAEAISGSSDGIDRFKREISERLAELEPAILKKVEKVIHSLERSK